MLLDNELDTYDIQDFCVETLQSDVDYQVFCTSLVGGVLNYETDTRIDNFDELPDYPFCVSFAGEEQQDLRVREWGHTYEIGLVFAIEDKKTFVPENSIKKYTDTRSIEKLTKEAIKVIKKKMRKYGVNGDYELTIVAADGEKTPTGEADDINYILSLTFGYLDDINK